MFSHSQEGQNQVNVTKYQVHTCFANDSELKQSSDQQLKDYLKNQQDDDCYCLRLLQGLSKNKISRIFKFSYDTNDDLVQFFEKRILALKDRDFIYQKSILYTCKYKHIDYVLIVRKESRISEKLCMILSFNVLIDLYTINQDVLNKLPVNMWWCDSYGNILMKNEQMDNVDDNWGLATNTEDECIYDVLLKHFPDSNADVENIIMNDLSVLSQKNTQYFEEMASTREEKLAYLAAKRYYVCKSTKIKGILGVSYDITKHKKNETEFERLRSKLTSDLEKIESLIVDMRHDFKSPLANIITIAEYLKNDMNGPNQAELLDSIYNCSQQLINLLDEIIEKTKYKDLEKITIDKIMTHEMIANIKSYLVIMTVDTDLETTVNLSQRSPQVIYSCQSRIERIINNLINNSAKFTNKGSITVNINFDYDSIIEKYFIIVEVLDTGIGIPDKDIEKIFDKYVKSGSSKGQGIGLSVVRNYVQQLDGHITVLSKENEGTRIIVKIPVIVAENRVVTSHY